MTVELIEGDCLLVMRELPDNSIDAIVTDPPYGLSFMGKQWDYDVPTTEVWAECLRVLKPGGHLLSFFGTRTYHRGVVRIEDAGFEIRDQIMWLYGSGFPKSSNQDGDWEGWGTALKPAHEPIVMARKPLIGTVPANLAAYGVGALNIDGCRVPTDENLSGGAYAKNATERDQMWGSNAGNSWRRGQAGDFSQPEGRWPANIIHDGSDEVIDAFPVAPGQQGDLSGQSKSRKSKGIYGDMPAARRALARRDSGSAARFFKSCEVDDTEWLAQNLNLSPALTAEQCSFQSSHPVASALAHAVSLELPEGLFCESLSADHSTSATPSELRLIATSVITAIQNIAPRFLREWQQERLSPSDSPVAVVAHRMPTGTMQITASHWKSNGSADRVTFNITPTNLEAGVKDSERSTARRIAYFPKASKSDRDEGLEHLPKKAAGLVSETSGQHITRRDDGYEVAPRANTHPTVKPTDLMRYLCRLVTPPGGTVLDPVMGSCSNGRGDVLEGCNFIGIEMDAGYFDIADARIAAAELRVAEKMQAAE